MVLPRPLCEPVGQLSGTRGAIPQSSLGTAGAGQAQECCKSTSRRLPPRLSSLPSHCPLEIKCIPLLVRLRLFWRSIWMLDFFVRFTPPVFIKRRCYRRAFGYIVFWVVDLIASGARLSGDRQCFGIAPRELFAVPVSKTIIRQHTSTPMTRH